MTLYTTKYSTHNHNTLSNTMSEINDSVLLDSCTTIHFRCWDLSRSLCKQEGQSKLTTDHTNDSLLHLLITESDAAKIEH